MRIRHIWIPLVAAVLLGTAASVSAQEDEASGGSGFSFGMGLNFGVASFESVDEDTGTATQESYQAIGLQPDFGYGKFGIAFDMILNYRFSGGADANDFEIREEDWVPDDDTTFLELYLPKFRYVRWGTKGDDLFARFGSFDDATMGNGFIVSNYSNELYLPDRRIFGAQLDLDGEFFSFPYAGIETMTGNVAAFDVVATRLYTRPLSMLPIPILPGLQVGATVAADRNPYYFTEKDPDSTVTGTADTVTIWGIDSRLPILSADMFSLALFGDLVFQDEALGGMVGTGGRFFTVFLYGAQIRLTGDGFIPAYFDRAYDRRRVERYDIYNGTAAEIPDGHAGWLAYLGLGILQDLLSFDVRVSGPFASGTGEYPELVSQLSVNEGVVPGFSGLSFDAYYNKFELREFNDIWDAQNAIIGAKVNMRSGPAIISLVYDLQYEPDAPAGQDAWSVTSRLETTIALK